MKKLKLIKENEVAISKELSVYCDFCGEGNGQTQVFTSSYIDNPDTGKNEPQICYSCITQLYKLLK